VVHHLVDHIGGVTVVDDRYGVSQGLDIATVSEDGSTGRNRESGDSCYAGEKGRCMTRRRRPG
jgi:hypothetical protein